MSVSTASVTLEAGPGGSQPDPATPSVEVAPHDHSRALALARELGVATPIATVLLARGLESAAEARAFIEGEPLSEPDATGGVAEAAARVEAAVEAGERVTVHGDYDADGVAATAILVSALRAVGAECDWYIPSRSEGYGLGEDGVRRMAERGTGLIVTVDCGISCASEVRLASGLGMEVIVTDHHEPAAELPEATIVHPRVSGGPCADLCGAAVAWKLASRLRLAAGSGEPDDDLDLVALATVADLVPLVGENRTIVRRGIEIARRGRRPGIRALAEVARIELESLGEEDLGYRLAPRVNAVGRLYRADAGVELMLTEQDGRARSVAAELERANRERRTVEGDVAAEAGRKLKALEPSPAERAAIVVWGEGWHPGVLGIVASRLVERHWRPTVVIGIDDRGVGRGSARGIPGYDVVAGLRACEGLLERFGGHVGAAGLEVARTNVEDFARALEEQAREAIDARDLVRRHQVDAVVGAESLGLGLAEQLEALRPFGQANPKPRLLVPGAEIVDPRPVGEAQRHTRLSLRTGASRAAAIRFGDEGRLLSLPGRRADVVAELELDRFNGQTRPRARVEEAWPLDGDGPTEPRPMDDSEWLERLERRLGEGSPAVGGDGPDGGPASGHGEDRGRERVEHVEGSTLALLSQLVLGGASVLAVCSDVLVRRGLAELTGVERLGGTAVATCGAQLAAAELERVRELAERRPALAVSDWPSLERLGDAVPGFDCVVEVDPAPTDELERMAGLGDGLVIRAWGEREVELALEVLEARSSLRPHCARIYSGLSRAEGGTLSGGPLLVALRGGEGGAPFATPEVAADSLAVLLELGIAQRERGPHGGTLGLLSSERTQLERSPTYGRARARLEEQTRFLRSRRTRTS